MLLATNFTRKLNHPRERMMLARIRRRTKSIPRRHTIMRELALPPVLFQTLKRKLQSIVKLLLRDVTQLRLRIVNVINIHTLEAHVAQRLIKLALQVRRRHAMTARDDVFERRNTRLHESLSHILSHTSWRSAVERQVAAFRADDEFFACDAVLAREYLQGGADRAFASLKTVVGSTVDDVDAELHGANDRARVVCIGGCVRVAEIRADPDRGKHKTVLYVEVAIGEAFAITGSALRCCAFSWHSERMLTGYVSL